MTRRRNDRIRVQVMGKTPRAIRQNELRDMVEQEPFLTDGELAVRFGVSVQTIRLDRLRLGIPELRERVRAMAAQNYAALRSLAPSEVFGDMVDLEVGRHALSVWRAQREHVIARSQIVRGHFLFAQANSLAVATIDAQRALTARATIRFVKPVPAQATVVASARVLGHRHGYALVHVVSQVAGDDVLIADFLIQSSVEIGEGGALDEDRG